MAKVRNTEKITTSVQISAVDMGSSINDTPTLTGPEGEALTWISCDADLIGRVFRADQKATESDADQYVRASVLI